MTQQKKRPLFREHALQHYMQRRENDILPRIVSPPVFLFVWLLFGIVLASGIMAWLERVPVYVNGTGIVVESEHKINAQQSEVNALVFIPVNAINHVRPGSHGLIQLGSATGGYFNSTVTSLEPLVLSPEAIQTHYMLSCSAAQQITEPSVAVHVKVLMPANDHVFNGTLLQARIQIGTQRVLALLPILDRLIGGS
ncbi:hypothetical protein [Dictyobacter kobayashii]|uniref:Uncharacterized protein n=1 Tax=Dictyobacter kobayashii TaxID=2014872 RepID=A0A402AXI9_9CHLR|nr:hypothetical protein [Dictyobacter kobayashii]GCE23816.1 hypothetical protein KDK_76160 [Dictyobacter kobayashii]